MLEMQLGGNSAGPLSLLDAAVNRSSGAQLGSTWLNKANPGNKYHNQCADEAERPGYLAIIAT